MTAVKACHILGVPSRTTWSDVRQAYLDLVKVWHPDRFQSDPSLQVRAAKRLAEINEAYEFLRDVHTARRSSDASRLRAQPKPSPTPQTSNTESSPPRPPEDARGQEAPAEPPFPPRAEAGQIIRRILGVGVIIVALMFAILLMPTSTLHPYLGIPLTDAPSSSKAEPLHVYVDKQESVPFYGANKEPWLEPDDHLPVGDFGKAEPAPARAEYAPTVSGVERPESGAELIVAAETDGLGSVNVRNGTSSDAVVILFRGDVQRRATYIRAGDGAGIPKVAAGTYSVRFTSGKWWNGEEFLKEATFSEFERALVFAETQEKDGIGYSDFKLTLNRVIGGNARIRQAPPFKLSKQILLEGR